MPIDLFSIGIGIIIQLFGIVMVYLFLPESIREPIRGHLLRFRKWVRDPDLDIEVSKRLELHEEMDAEELRGVVANTLRTAKLWRQDEVPRSFEFPIELPGFVARTELSVSYDESLPEGVALALVSRVRAKTTYRRLRETLENLRAAEDIVRRELQSQLAFRESRPQTKIGLQSEFPMAGFFREVEPLILHCQTKDHSIDFDYLPGSLTMHGELDARSIRWVSGALSAL